MINTDFIDDIAKRLCDALPPGVQTLKKDLERNFRAVLQNTFAKLDLVTREEFDAQTGVLMKTRTKLEKLEKQMEQLEKQHLDKHAKKEGKSRG